MKILIYNDISLATSYRAGNVNAFMSLLSWLATVGDVTVLQTHYRRPSRSLPPNVKIVWRPDYFNFIARNLRKRLGLSLPLLKHKDSWFKRWFFSRLIRSNDWDLLLIEYIDNCFLLDCCLVPTSITCIADLHDLFSARGASFRRHSVFTLENNDIDLATELAAIARFNKVIFLQASEAAIVNAALDKQHALVTRRSPGMSAMWGVDAIYSPGALDSPLRIGFIGTTTEFNVDAARQLIGRCDVTQGVVCLIAGSVCTLLPEAKDLNNISLLGPMESLAEFYGGIDVAANLIRFGSGLKTKNVEALLFGVPVITTSVGAEGLEDFIGHGLYIAENKEDWETAMRDIHRVGDLAQNRHRLRERARAAFDPDLVFASLRQFLIESSDRSSRQDVIANA